MTDHLITLLHEPADQVTDGGRPLLLAGTKSRLYRMTPDQSWMMLHAIPTCDKGGVMEHWWGVAQLSGVVLVAHTSGPVWTYNAGGQHPVVDKQTGLWTYLEPVDSLIVLEIRAARVVAQSHGFFFLADITESGQRLRSKLIWSDFEDPRNFLPGGESLAGYVEFGGDPIVALKTLGNSLVVYCQSSIWLGAFVGGDLIWSFERVYVGPDTPMYPRTVVNTGDEHVYLGSDTIHVFRRGERAPRSLQWLDQAAGVIYIGLDEQAAQGGRKVTTAGLPAGLVEPFRRINAQDCMSPCGGLDSVNGNLWFSWRPVGTDRNLKSLVVHLETSTSCVVDHGFTAFTMSRVPRYGETETMRTFIARYKVCTWNPESDLTAPLLNEHQQNLTLSDCPEAAPTSLYNGLEDPDLAPDEDSLCSAMKDCGDPCMDCPPCSSEPRYVMASSLDGCLKEYDSDCPYREEYQPEDPEFEPVWNNLERLEARGMAIGPNEYIPGVWFPFRNFITLMQTDSIKSKSSSVDVEIDRVVLTVSGDSQFTNWTAGTTGDDLAEVQGLMDGEWPVFGHGAGGEAPNCMTWGPVDQDVLACRNDDEELPEYVHPSTDPILHFSVAGRYAAWRFWLGDGKLLMSDNLPNMAGPVAFGSATVWAANNSC